MKGKITVLVVDDHAVLAQGIASLLEEHEAIQIVGMAHTGQSAIVEVRKLDPDVVLLDINLPDKDGLEVCEELVAAGYAGAILGLSMHEEEAFITGMLERGAAGYLLKSVTQSELVEAIHTVDNGGSYYSKEVTQTLVDELVRKQKSSARKPETIIEISDREREVLALIMKEHTTKEIGKLLFISQNTVETHRRHLLEKLGARNSAGLVRIAMERGLLG